jgi:hypothetical protein
MRRTRQPLLDTGKRILQLDGEIAQALARRAYRCATAWLSVGEGGAAGADGIDAEPLELSVAACAAGL